MSAHEAIRPLARAPQAPAGATTLDAWLARARANLLRVDAHQAARALHDGALLVDIRCERQRLRDGTVQGAVFVERNVLEWRCAPSSPARDERLSDPERLLILMCDGGYQSSLAAASLQELGLPRATDLIGGFQEWKACGLPVLCRARR